MNYMKYFMLMNVNKWSPIELQITPLLNFRVFWRTIGNKNPTKNDTKETNILITGLKDDVTYELVMKATNQMGTSMLTDPVKFSTAEKYITSAASLGGKVYFKIFCLAGNIPGSPICFKRPLANCSIGPFFYVWASTIPCIYPTRFISLVHLGPLMTSGLLAAIKGEC